MCGLGSGHWPLAVGLWPLTSGFCLGWRMGLSMWGGRITKIDCKNLSSALDPDLALGDDGVGFGVGIGVGSGLGYVPPPVL